VISDQFCQKDHGRQKTKLKNLQILGQPEIGDISERTDREREREKERDCL
jgi:hypothetical protein